MKLAPHGRSSVIHRSPFTPPCPSAAFEQRWVVRLGLRVLHYYMGGYHRVTLANACPIPRQGPAILLSNHISAIDPLVLQLHCPRLIVWMMAREYDIAPLHWMFKTIGVIPVNRGGQDMAATRAALRALADGHVLGIFPQGRLSMPGEDLRFRSGAALLAIKSGAPVYPACIEGTMQGQMLSAFALPQQARVAFGEPLSLGGGETSRQALDAATVEMANAVAALRQRYLANPGC